MQNNNLFHNKLKSIHNKLLSSQNEKDILSEIDSLYDLIQSKYIDLDFFKKLDEIINEILNEDLLKNETYAQGFIKKYLNIYFNELKIDIYSSWGLVFLKILYRKNNIHYPLIYSSILKIFFKYLESEYSIKELSFPIADNVNFFEIINDWLPVIDKLINESSSYNLLFNASTRNKIILYLYDLYNKNNSLNIWFPCSGIGTEPLLFSILLNLIHEIKTNDDKMKNFKIYCSDPNNILLEEGLRINPLNDLLLKTKSDFAKENNVNVKNLKTAIKDAKKNLITKNNNFLSTGKYLEENFDIVIINSLKLSDLTFFKKKLIKRLNRLNEINRDIIVIYEAKTSEKIDENEFNLENINYISLIDSTLISKKEIDYFLSYLIFELRSQKDDKTTEKDNSLSNIYNNYKNIDQKELKKAILKINKETIQTKKDFLIYAFLLAKAALFNKSYDILKNYYSNDYNFSYKILKIIIKSTKNNKVINKIQNFIFEKQIKEKGFTAELLDALTDGIEEYKIEEKKYKNQKRWL